MNVQDCASAPTATLPPEEVVHKESRYTPREEAIIAKLKEHFNYLFDEKLLEKASAKQTQLLAKLKKKGKKFEPFLQTFTISLQEADDSQIRQRTRLEKYFANPKKYLADEASVQRVYKKISQEDNKITLETFESIAAQLPSDKNRYQQTRTTLKARGHQMVTKEQRRTALECTRAAKFFQTISEIASLNDKTREAEFYANALIEEENEKSQTIDKTSKPKKRTPSKKKKAAKNSSEKKIERPPEPTATKIVETAEILRNKRVIQLHNVSVSFKVVSRVTRWSEKSPNVIKGFQDKGSSGNSVTKYSLLTDEEIAEQRARHYLPNLEKLIASPEDREVYAFKTEKGWGMMAEFHRTGQPPKYGVIYLGITNNYLFHKYFEEREMEVKAIMKGQTEKLESKETMDKEWTPTTNTNFALSENGVLTVSFVDEDHFLRIYPLTSKLDPKLFTIQMGNS